jgi:hypothetical protein
VKAIGRRLARLETHVARIDVQEPSPAAILREGDGAWRQLGFHRTRQRPLPLDGRSITVSEVLRQRRFLRRSAVPGKLPILGVNAHSPATAFEVSRWRGGRFACRSLYLTSLIAKRSISPNVADRNRS